MIFIGSPNVFLIPIVTLLWQALQSENKRANMLTGLGDWKRAGGVASDTGEIFVFAQPKHLAPTPCCWHARRCDMRCNLSRAFLGKPHNLRRDLSPNELPLPPATAWLLVRVEFLPTWRNHAKRSPNLEIWSLSSYICGGCVICQVPASDARPYLRDWEDDCMLGVEGGGAVFWAQLYNQTVINDSRPTGK